MPSYRLSEKLLAVLLLLKPWRPRRSVSAGGRETRERMARLTLWARWLRRRHALAVRRRTGCATRAIRSARCLPSEPVTVEPEIINLLPDATPLPIRKRAGGRWVTVTRANSAMMTWAPWFF